MNILSRNDLQEFRRLVAVAHAQGQRDPAGAIRWIKIWTVNSVPFSGEEREFRLRLRKALILFPKSAKRYAGRVLQGGAK